MNKKHRSIKALGAFVVILIVAFGAVTWFTGKALKVDYQLEMEAVDKAEWSLLSNSLSLLLNQAKQVGDVVVSHVDSVTMKEFDNDYKKIAYTLDNYMEPDNYLRTLLTNQVDKLYFNDIVSDNTDGFIVKGFYVATDKSSNCASFGTQRTFDQELLMHANPVLALEAFTRIAQGDIENYNTGAIDKPIFFQFTTHPDGIDMQKGYNIPKEHQGKLGLELTSYDMAGLKSYFMETKSWEKTFYAFEFVTPTYIFNHKDLAGRAYIDNGLRTDTERLSINIVFNFKTVIDHNPILKRDLAQFENQREIIQKDYLDREFILYLVVILLIIICFLAMHYTNGLLEKID